MGYTHYWYRVKHIPLSTFKRIVDDFKKLLPYFNDFEIKLAGPDGTGEPIINYDEVAFNGKTDCGHPKNEHIIIPWPDEQIIPGVAPSPSAAVNGQWIGGVVLKQRCCNGDCSYESFFFPRIERDNSLLVDKAGKYYFGSCKTAFRPYDIAVTSFLVIAKKHLKNDIIVESDGEPQHWNEAFWFCKTILKYDDEDIHSVIKDIVEIKDITE
ncbi:MAG: hypothetical protein QXQ33_00795 [Nitrososphaerota archaeon]